MKVMIRVRKKNVNHISHIIKKLCLNITFSHIFAFQNNIFCLFPLFPDFYVIFKLF